MAIVFGSRLMGKVDEVPGLFHVATKFAHVDYVPLIPLESYVITWTDGKKFRGIRIRLSGRSILFAWIRAISLVAFVAMAIWAIVDLTGHGTIRPVLGASSLAAAVVFYLFTWHKPLRRASFNRANELAALLKMGPQAFERIQAIYGQSAGRGFDVLQPADARESVNPGDYPPIVG